MSKNSTFANEGYGWIGGMLSVRDEIEEFARILKDLAQHLSFSEEQKRGFDQRYRHQIRTRAVVSYDWGLKVPAEMSEAGREFLMAATLLSDGFILEEDELSCLSQNTRCTEALADLDKRLHELDEELKALRFYQFSGHQRLLDNLQFVAGQMKDWRAAQRQVDMVSDYIVRLCMERERWMAVASKNADERQKLATVGDDAAGVHDDEAVDNVDKGGLCDADGYIKDKYICDYLRLKELHCKLRIREIRGIIWEPVQLPRI